MSFGQAFDSVTDQIEQILAQVREEIREKVGEAQQIDLIGSAKAFIAAVNWTEPFIVCLLAFHVVVALSIAVARNNQIAMSAIFCTIASIVFGAERLNRLGAQHWEKFATQDYFDRHGFFLTVMLSTPLLVLLLVILAKMLLDLANLLVKAQRQKLRLRARREGQQNGEPKKSR